jgi:small conductance mechanosensitive channel
MMSFDQLTQMVIPMITAWGLKVILAIALMIIGRFVAGFVRSMLRKGLTRADVDETLIPFLASLGYYTVMAMVLIAVLGVVGVQTASLVAVLGAAGLAIGLALQGTLSNLAAGVMLLVFRPFSVDDAVEAGGSIGKVEAIRLFTTVMNTPDNVRITIPNSAVWGGTVKNFSANDQRRIDLVMGVDYGDDLGLAVRTIETIVSSDSRVLSDPGPTVAVAELGDSSVNIVVRPWVNTEEYWDVRFDLMRALKEGLEGAGVSFPFPQTDVHLHQVSGDSAA